jgi:hypothetical protein
MNFLIKLRTTRIRCRDDDGVLWIDPTMVDRFCGSKWPHCHITQNYLMRRVFELNPRFSFLTLGGDWDKKSKTITETEKYLMMKDFIERLDNFEDSVWYRQLVDSYQSSGFATHKKIFMYSVDDIKSFFINYAIPLATSLSASGYKYRAGDEVGSIAIDRSGSIHKAGSGTHRFFLSKILGVRSVPVQVTFVHSEWLQNEGLTLKRRDRWRVLERIRRNLSHSAIDATVPVHATSTGSQLARGHWPSGAVAPFQDAT